MAAGLLHEAEMPAHYYGLYSACLVIMNSVKQLKQRSLSVERAIVLSTVTLSHSKKTLYGRSINQLAPSIRRNKQELFGMMRKRFSSRMVERTVSKLIAHALRFSAYFTH